MKQIIIIKNLATASKPHNLTQPCALESQSQGNDLVL